MVYSEERKYTTANENLFLSCPTNHTQPIYSINASQNISLRQIPLPAEITLLYVCCKKNTIRVYRWIDRNVSRPCKMYQCTYNSCYLWGSISSDYEFGSKCIEINNTGTSCINNTMSAVRFTTTPIHFWDCLKRMFHKTKWFRWRWLDFVLL